MKRISYAILALILGVVHVAPPAAAQNTAPAQAPERPGQNEEPVRPLDRLFEQLKAAKDEAEAKSLTVQIERIWSRSGSDTADLLLQRVAQAIASQDTDLALDLLDSALALTPEWAEAWNRRATVLFIRRDLDASVRDIGEVLAREPRHFGAWSGLGLIFLQIDRKPRALLAFQKALEINPYLESAKQSVERLKKELEGSAL